jgi:DNA-binding transcriptional LysR family regulator
MSLFDDMRVFTTVVETGSFSGAARRLGVAKSVISRRIAVLEARLQASLFNRTTRRLSVTEIGRAYFDRARRILDDVIEAEDAARSLHGELVGRLRLAAPLTFSRDHLSEAVATFLSEHPRLEIELDLNDRHVDLVNEGFDLAIRIGELPDSSLIARYLAPCRRVVCASPSYLAQFGEPRTLDDLTAQEHRCLVYSNRLVSAQWRFRVGDDWQSPKVQAHRLIANEGHTLRDAAIAGLGLVVLPTFVVSPALVRGQLRAVLKNYSLPEPSIYAVWPPGRQLSAKVRALVEMMAQRYGGVPYWDQAIADA